MDDYLLRSRINLPVTTGIAPAAATHTPSAAAAASAPEVSFRQLLEKKAQDVSLTFSRHAAGRLAQRDIELSDDGMQRLSEGVDIAREKGIRDALILLDGAAFIVSAQNSTVITALNRQELQSKAITNIDGTVIL